MRSLFFAVLPLLSPAVFSLLFCGRRLQKTRLSAAERSPAAVFSRDYQRYQRTPPPRTQRASALLALTTMASPGRGDLCPPASDTVAPVIPRSRSAVSTSEALDRADTWLEQRRVANAAALALHSFVGRSWAIEVAGRARLHPPLAANPEHIAAVLDADKRKQAGVVGTAPVRPCSDASRPAGVAAGCLPGSTPRSPQTRAAG